MSEWNVDPKGWRNRPMLRRGWDDSLEIGPDDELDMELDFDGFGVRASVPMSKVIEFLTANGYRVESPAAAREPKETPRG